ncbi:MAG: neutral/alkaline non-lysosomal ceramidase N-terminal domain-containing protein [Sandaracinaceae bacterium]|nr:neutral/alkaline non-lysosomal ceramidase N-terminal domain-containing protein [Sandaracinaceae bacterium]
MTLRAGLAKVDVTVFEPGMAMLGWGRPDHVPERVAHPLHARALVIEEGGRALAHVVVDLCFVSTSLRVGVLAELARRGVPIAPSDVMLTATHTHAGPNGYSHAFFYDLGSLGFSRLVYETLVDGISDAIAEAHARLEPARLRLGAASVDGDVARNRSLDAHRQNRDALADGVDRELLALRVDDRAGRGLGVLSLFALHATSIHGDVRALHPDHKGLAAEAFEGWARGAGHAPHFVALFGQGAAGDVSPNVRFDASRGVMVGARGDDEASARHVADAQVDATRRAFEGASLELTGPIDAAARHVDFEERFVPPSFAGGVPARTTRARLGLAMAAGTAEGPGPLGRSPLPRRWGARDPKITLLEVGPDVRRRLLGVDPRRAPIPHAAFEHARRAGGLDRAWIPTVLPVQVMRLGRFALAALPNEPTTTVGHRLRARLEPLLGVDRLHVQGYANAYAGYLTTPEEYARQRYEGAYTLFGPHTLGAFEHALGELGDELCGEPRAVSGPPLLTCTEAELASRAFSDPGPA